MLVHRLCQRVPLSLPKSLPLGSNIHYHATLRKYSWYWPFSSTPVEQLSVMQPVNASSKADAITEDVKLVPISEDPVLVSDVMSGISNETVGALDSAIVSTVSELSQFGLGGYTMRGMMQQSFEYFHVVHGLPWWLSIPAVIIAFRLVTFPAAVIQARSQFAVPHIKDKMDKFQLESRELMSAGKNTEAMLKQRQNWAMMKQNGARPMLSLFLALAQIPFLYLFFMSIREMAYVLPSMTEGGFAWFLDLSKPDPYFIIPLVNAGIMLINLKLTSMVTKMAGWMKAGAYAMTAMSVPFSYLLPVAVQLYILSQASFHMGLALLWRLKPIRLFFNIKDPIYIQMQSKASFKELQQVITANSERMAKLASARSEALARRNV